MDNHQLHLRLQHQHHPPSLAQQVYPSAPSDAELLSDVDFAAVSAAAAGVGVGGVGHGLETDGTEYIDQQFQPDDVVDGESQHIEGGEEMQVHDAQQMVHPHTYDDHGHAHEEMDPGMMHGDQSYETEHEQAEGAEGEEEPRRPLPPIRKKREKLVMACHFCRRRKLKCDGSRPCCDNCFKRNEVCQWDNNVRRRGPGRRTKVLRAAAMTEAAHAGMHEAAGGDAHAHTLMEHGQYIEHGHEHELEQGHGEEMGHEEQLDHAHVHDLAHAQDLGHAHGLEEGHESQLEHGHEHGHELEYEHEHEHNPDEEEQLEHKEHEHEEEDEEDEEQEHGHGHLHRLEHARIPDFGHENEQLGLGSIQHESHSHQSAVDTNAALIAAVAAAAADTQQHLDAAYAGELDLTDDIKFQIDPSLVDAQFGTGNGNGSGNGSGNGNGNGVGAGVQDVSGSASASGSGTGAQVGSGNGSGTAKGLAMGMSLGRGAGRVVPGLGVGVGVGNTSQSQSNGQHQQQQQQQQQNQQHAHADSYYSYNLPEGDVDVDVSLDDIGLEYLDETHGQ